MFNQLHSQPAGGYSPSIASVSEDLNEILSSEKIKTILRVIDGSTNIFSGYDFTMGLDNVRVGLSTYHFDSIYVSPPFRSENVAQISLKTTETRPAASTPTGIPEETSSVYDQDDSQYFFSSIEYWVIKRDFDIDDNIIKTVKFPILPLNVSRTHHEKLFLTEKSSLAVRYNNIGSLMFFTNVALGDVKVYRNGILLVYNLDWIDVTTSANKTPGNGDRMLFKLQVSNVLLGDIYTVSYNPMTSSTRAIPQTISAYTGTGIDAVDLIGDLTIRPLPSQIVVIDEGINTENIKRSEFFLAIILRNNSSKQVLTAAVEEFMFVFGNRSNNFEDIENV